MGITERFSLLFSQIFTNDRHFFHNMNLTLKRYMFRNFFYTGHVIFFLIDTSFSLTDPKFADIFNYLVKV